MLQNSKLFSLREGVAYRTKQFLSKQTHSRTTSTDQKQTKNAHLASRTQEKARAVSQQARRDRGLNSSGINYDNSMDDSMNASFLANKYLPHGARHSNNHSFDVGPRARTSHKADRTGKLNVTMPYPELRGRNPSRDAIFDGKYNTGGMLNSSAKKNSAKKHLI